MKTGTILMRDPTNLEMQLFDELHQPIRDYLENTQPDFRQGPPPKLIRLSKELTLLLTKIGFMQTPERLFMREFHERYTEEDFLSNPQAMQTFMEAMLALHGKQSRMNPYFRQATE